MNFKGNRKAPQYAEDITLDEKVKTLPPDSIIAIGAAARFFYIGTAKEWLRTEKDMDRRTAEDKLKIWEETVKGKKLAAKRNGTVYIEPPKPEHIPFGGRKLLDAYKSITEKKLIIKIEGTETGNLSSLKDLSCMSEEDMAKDFIRKRYAFVDGRIVSKRAVENDGYEQIRELIINTRAQAFKMAYEDYLSRPTPENETKAACAELKLKDNTFRTLSAGLDSETIIRMIKEKAKQRYMMTD